jgi:hypothetical protein
MKRVLWITALFLSLIIITIGVIPVQADTGIRQASRIHISKGSSTNWSGYVVEYPSLTSSQSNVSYVVKGTWIVPTVRISNPLAYAAIWVGIDGYNSGTVEQIGTLQISDGTCFAWYEMYPAPMIIIPSVPITPGDLIFAEVKSHGKTSFTLTIKNLTTDRSFTITKVSSIAECTSAEWIVEAPASGDILPLADFGTVVIKGASALVNGSIQALICVDMIVSRDGPSLKADAIPTSNSSDITVVWKHS